MIYFRSDYSQGALPEVMEALEKTNEEHTDGYGMDEHCKNAERLVRELIGKPDAHVHMMVGGTPANVIFASACLKPYEAMISARSGHAYFHETGAIEATGHRVITAEGTDGKLTVNAIEEVLSESQDEHTPMAKLVYLSQPTETGTLYSKAELTGLRRFCEKKGLFLYIDGARLGAALTSKENDIDIKELADLCDAFYIGGTKNGALFGEALVILNGDINDHFRWMIKRHCGLLAKGRLIGVQFEALLNGGENSPYFKAAAHANEMADRLRSKLGEMGVKFYGTSPTNQIFPVLPAKAVRELKKEFFFYEWAAEKDGMIPIRLVTGWGTKPSEIEAFLDACRDLLNS